MANIDNPVAEMAPDGFYRVALGVEYKGSRYSGWQRQLTGVATVQEELEKALSKVANSPVSLQCAGRTDAGVHACGQVVHFRYDGRSFAESLGHGRQHQSAP